MRTAEQINEDIQNDFFGLTGKVFRPSSGIGFFTNAVARATAKAHKEIEDNKNPHIYTNLQGEDLDKFGAMVNVPRLNDESDTNYLYRLMNWTYLKSGANLTAINDSLLQLEHASDAQYYPQVNGAGTGVVYIIPKDYSDEAIQDALTEAKDRIKNVIDPESYTEYIVPTPLPVIVMAHIETSGDIQYIKDQLAAKFKEYINAIAPNDYLSLGKLNSIAYEMDGVDFFTIDGVYINGSFRNETKILQELETKLLFEEMSWRG